MRDLLTFATAVVVSCGACAGPASQESNEALFGATRVDASIMGSVQPQIKALVESAMGEARLQQ